jgi:hypothetical protein
VAVTWTLTAEELIRLVCAMIAVGIIGGAPIWIWVMSLPVPKRHPRDVDLGEVADALDQAAAIVRERAATPPPR